MNTALAAAAPRYTTTAAVLHALLAVLIVAALGLGWWMNSLPMGLQRLKLINWHKWLGVTILALSLLRLLWRLAHRPPAAPPMPAWQARAAAAVQGLMYLLFLAVPLLGWAYSSAAGFPVVWLGLLPLPDGVAPDRELALAIKPWHGRAAWLLAVLAAGHVVAALHHHFVLKDGLLRRMTPWP